MYVFYKFTYFLYFLLSVSILLCTGCNIYDVNNKKIFRITDSEKSNVDFENSLSHNNNFNLFTYKDFYAGGGVAIGDINNDSLMDVYLVANQKMNRLYINKGNFEFKDVTKSAGVGGSKPWSTGVSMADVNGDGLLDIYVLNAGAYRGEDRSEEMYENELFINNGDTTFSARGEVYGLDDKGNSIHASFFDYDNDGDLDLYLLNNHNSKPVGEYQLRNINREDEYFRGGDRFYRNEIISNTFNERDTVEGTLYFTDVTQETGIYSNEIGFGLGVSVADINRDGWMDIYVSNDFFEKDYLYINNKNGTFEEVVEQKTNTISASSMGGDIADINNNIFPDIFITEMLPKNEFRIKTVMSYISWNRYVPQVKMGYHNQFKRNTLQVNINGNNFGEVGRYSGVEATDWSWGGLIADFNLSGRRDIFVPNGVYKDETNKDFLVESRKMIKRRRKNNKPVTHSLLLDMIPVNPISNYIFENTGNVEFTNRSSEWGISQRSFSTGSAYGDLDNDGDLDLVVNNVNMEAFIYRNRVSKLHPKRNWIRVDLEGQVPNTQGIGAQVEVVADGRKWYVEQMPQRGFQSSMDPRLHFGLGAGISTIDTLKVRWPDGRLGLRTDVETNQQITLRQEEARSPDQNDYWVLPAGRTDKNETLLKDVTGEVGLDWEHDESSYNDFEQSPLLFHMRSTEGPPLCVGDVNGDGQEDVYVGGAAEQPGALFVRGDSDQFERVSQPALEADRKSEDTGCVFFDADGDGFSELYVASGSSEFPAGSSHLADRFYQTDGGGTLVHSDEALPRPKGGHTPTGTVRAGDVDGDGDQDLFVGTRMTPPADSAGYGMPVGGVLLENDGTGRFRPVTNQRAPGLRAQELNTPGVTDAAWGDLNGNGHMDLVVAGEWMPLTVFFNKSGHLEPADLAAIGLDSTRGWWQSITLADLDGNGALDLVGGNHGLNSRFRAGPDQPVEMWAGDFNQNGQVEQISASYNDGEGPYPVALYQKMVQQLPYLKSEYSTFSDYAETTVSEIFSSEQLEDAEHYGVDYLSSAVAWNEGEGRFRVDSLPFRAQLAPMYGTLAEDLVGDGVPEIMMGGNLHAVQPQAGPYHASKGALLRQDSSDHYRDMPSQESGFSVSGEIRSIISVPHKESHLILVARNDASLQVYRVKAP